MMIDPTIAGRALAFVIMGFVIRAIKRRIAAHRAKLPPRQPELDPWR